MKLRCGSSIDCFVMIKSNPSKSTEIVSIFQWSYEPIVLLAVSTLEDSAK